MKLQSLAAAATAVAAAVVLLATTAIPSAAAATVEHTFVVSQVKMTHMCREALITVVNGQLPGPTIEVTEGDTVVVHLVNKSPYNMTIHWHGVKQRRNCWNDGVPMITQRPILPNHNFTYRFDVTGQEGTLWWHAHVACLRGSVHGALIIRPRHGADSYPFPKPHKEVPIVLGDWWEMDLDRLDRDFVGGFLFDHPNASTINGKLGDLFSCNGAAEDGYVLDVEPGKTYLLRLINAALFSEYFIKIAGHKFTVVAADANYVTPYTTNVIPIAPGETVDALVVADAPPGRYYIVSKPSETPPPDPPIQVYATRGMVRYKNAHVIDALSSSRGEEDDQEEDTPSDDAPMVPEMPDKYDMMTSYYFHGNLTSLHQPRRPPVPAQVDERLIIALGMGTICLGGRKSCKRSGSTESMTVATVNNVSFELPAAVAAPLLEAQYYHRSNKAAAGVELYTLPDRPPRTYNYTDRAMIWFGPEERPLEATKRATVARRFRHGAVVEVVFQSTALLQSDSNPMHLHGHDVFVVAQGLDNYDAARDVARYNLVDPPVRNTVRAPRLGWVAVRFVADNPGIWYMHCHYEFHLSMGMTALFIVEDGPTADTSLPPPPAGFPKCDHDDCLRPDELYLPTKEIEGSRVNGV